MATSGVWRTVAGRRIFIQKGQSVSDAMKSSGKFEKKKIKGRVSKKKAEDEYRSAISQKSRFEEKMMRKNGSWDMDDRLSGDARDDSEKMGKLQSNVKTKQKAYESAAKYSKTYKKKLEATKKKVRQNKD